MRILTSSKSSLEIDIFRDIDAFIVYQGYPWPDAVDDLEVMDECGGGYVLSVKDETLSYKRFDLSQSEIERISKRAREYLKIHRNFEGSRDDDEISNLFDDIMEQLGLTH